MTSTAGSKRWGRRLLAGLGVALALGGIAAGLWLQWVILDGLPSDLSHLRRYRPPTSCQIFSVGGVLVDEFHLERRFWVTLDEVPDHVIDAFIASEDRRFWQHGGIDLFGIARAAIVNLVTDRPPQGGSTLTQQLVKNLLVGSERSYERKLREAVLARRLERELGKAAVLELYLNYVYLGGGNYGVEAAARDYFGVSVADLDVGQAALLAGLVPAPSKYSPSVSRERARARRGLVLRRMVAEGFLDPQMLDSLDQDPVLEATESPPGERIGLAYITEVRRALREQFGSERASTAGMRVMTPLRLEVQAAAETAVRAALEAHAARQGRGRPSRHLDPGQWVSFLARGPGLRRGPAGPEPASVGECFEGLLSAVGRQPRLRAAGATFTLRPEDVPRLLGPVTKTMTSTVPAMVVGPRPGDIHRVCRVEGEAVVALDDRPWAEGAAIAAELATGRVLALVGGWASQLEGFVRATQARRQPGSAFKPMVYAAALESGRTQSSTVLDGPLSLPGAGGQPWRPKNYDGRFRGQVNLRTALAQSLNTPAVRLALEVGVARVVDVAHRLGVQTPLRTDPTVALGSSEVTLAGLIRAYGTIARAGAPMHLGFIDAVKDVDGQLVSEPGRSSPGWPALPPASGPRAIGAGIAAELDDMLREVVLSGTARRAHLPGHDRAGKTGTTNDNIDAWFVGYDARYVVGVWVGTDGPQSLGDGETGGRAALPAWLSIMQTLGTPDGATRPLPDGARLERAADGRVRVMARGRTPLDVDPRQPLPFVGARTSSRAASGSGPAGSSAD